ncbi:MAG: TetR/AcrR family transcriptional regulator [Solirubrobacterales bacterium]|nr:TetR/AcrR family transcriptional regulator [Solirubrobacterales bacterium]
MTPSAETRKRAAHLGPERRRPQVLDAALHLFLKGGYDGTSMEDVAHAAGVTKPVVYACFSSKDELFRSLLAREEELILAEVQGAFKDADLSDPEKTLTEGFTGFLRAVDKRPEVYKLIFFGEGGGNAAVAERVQAGRAQQVEALSALARNWLEAKNGNGSASSLNADARLIGHVLDGLAESGARLLLSGQDGWTPASLGRQLGRLAASAQAGLR